MKNNVMIENVNKIDRIKNNNKNKNKNTIVFASKRDEVSILLDESLLVGDLGVECHKHYVTGCFK